MKLYKKIGVAAVAVASMMGLASCNEELNLSPITEFTPEMYYKSADQLSYYLNNYYASAFTNPRSGYGSMFHQADYVDGLNRSDVNTDIACVGGGSTSLFTPDLWEAGAGKVLQGYYGNVRVWNFFIKTAETNKEAKQISGDETLINNYIGEGYFFRALAYWQILALYGDAPIVTEVLRDVDADIVAASERKPRNEVARFILSDLDKAISLLCDRSKFNGQRVNKQVAAALKSRIALFEGTFEKYHKGSGRVPGDANWPGKNMPYNSGKTFNIDSEVSFFLDQAMKAAVIAVGSTELTENNNVQAPTRGKITGFNPYFEMYSQASLAAVPEVLLWRQYNKASFSISHNAPYRTLLGCNDGMTRAFTEGFLMSDGKPCYASDLYKGDVSIDATKENRDQRYQLFMWSESTVSKTDNAFAEVSKLGGDSVVLKGVPNVHDALTETRAVTGYQSRKYFCYDYQQTFHDQILATNACPMFRVAEAMLNYIEACVEKTGSVDGTAKGYWEKLRQRAGVNKDFMVTVNATDLNKELQWSVYSGTSKVSSLLFNVRRERVCETFNEGLRFMDLIRWRSMDKLMTQKWIPEGVNFWDKMWENKAYTDTKTGQFNVLCDGSSSAVISGKEQGKYLRPYSASQMSTNLLRDGYTWKEAFYLYPLGLEDITSASSDRDVATSKLYQNLYWPVGAGKAEK